MNKGSKAQRHNGVKAIALVTHPFEGGRGDVFGAEIEIYYGTCDFSMR